MKDNTIKLPSEVVHVSNCCGAYVRHPESDICSECFEHCEVSTEEEYFN